MPVNEAIAYYDAGEDITCHCEAAVTGKRFVAISDPMQAGFAGLASTSAGGNPVVSPAGAGVKAFGVATYDAAIGAKVPVMRGHKVVPVTSGAAITAGAEVESDATGRAITLAAGKALGIALNTTTAAGQDTVVALDL